MGLAYSQLNPMMIFLSLSMVSDELGIEIEINELKNMYNIKTNEVDVGCICQLNLVAT